MFDFRMIQKPRVLSRNQILRFGSVSRLVIWCVIQTSLLLLGSNSDYRGTTDSLPGLGLAA